MPDPSPEEAEAELAQAQLVVTDPEAANAACQRDWIRGLGQ